MNFEFNCLKIEQKYFIFSGLLESPGICDAVKEDTEIKGLHTDKYWFKQRLSNKYFGFLQDVPLRTAR